MIEFWDYLSQFLAVTAGFCAALRAYLKSRRQPWFLLTCFYGTFALGTLYWTLHLLLRQEPQTGVAEIAGRVGYDSASKFAAAFKEVKGKTPLEYRREVQ